jgi:uncharacterized protein (TIGR03663 family)
MRTGGVSWVCGWLSALVVLALALALRLPRLDLKPMHGDEANQAVRTGLLLEQGVYHYDPTDHHGPALYFAALPFCRATAKTFAETTEWNFRLVPVAFSCLTLLLMLGLGGRREDGVFANRHGLAAAALLTAVSPAMAYYSRFFIQESMFVTFLTGMLVCAVRYVRARASAPTSDLRPPSSDLRSSAWAAGFGVFAGLAVATKETVVLSFAAAAVAAMAACGFRRLLRAWDTRHALVALGCAALVAVLLYSSFLTYPRGVYDALFSTVNAYVKRATAVPEHQHPWDFYLRILFWFKYGRGPVWSEAGLLPFAVLALVAACRRCRGADGGSCHAYTRWVRFVAVYTLVLTGLYSAIPYKTPWCSLSFLHGFILLAGIGFGELFAWLEKHPVPRVRYGDMLATAPAFWLLLALLLRADAQARRACFRLPADPRNPYVYAHTGADAMNLVAAIDAAAAKAQGLDTPIALAVPTPDTWPLPWYLRKYRQVGYWTCVDDIPASFQPVAVIAAAEQGDLADERFGKGKRASFFGIRPGVLLNLFVPER